MRVKRGRKRRAEMDSARWGTLARRFDGWQPGLLAVLVAWGAAILIVPRSVPPTEVPAALVPAADLAALRASEGQLAAHARAALPPPVRTLGSAVRAVGRAESARDRRAAGAAQGQIEAAMTAIANGMARDVAALRAYQTAAFIAALHAWEETGTRSEDLLELGGGLVDVVAARCATDGGRRRVAMDDDELTAAYHKRWNLLVRPRPGPVASAIELPLVEERLLFDFALRHRTEGALQGDARTRTGLAGQALLRRVDAHARIDPEYPADFARGVVFYRTGQFARAVQAFQRHLAAHADGPLAARAHGHARAAMAAEVGDDPSASWLPF